jgi:ribosome-associated protein
MTAKKKAPARAAKRRPRRRTGPDAELQAALAAVQDRKGVDPVVIVLRDLSDATDYFLVVSGTSDTHVRAIAENVVEALGAAGVRPYNVEGLQAGRWVCLDFVDFVVHVFHPTLRAFYQLEGLWGDAPQSHPA